MTSSSPPSLRDLLRFHRLTTRNLQSDRVHRPVCKQMKGTLRPRCRASSAAVIPSDDLDVADGRSCANGSVKASVDSPPENSAPPPIPCLRVRNLLMAHSAVDPAPEAFQPFGSFSTVMGTRTVMRSWPEALMTASGRVSRVSPVQTAMRNCTGGEGGPFEVGNQVLTQATASCCCQKQWC
jgi:hypothetical protein